MGLILWHPKGAIARNVIRDFWEKEHLKNGYQLVCTPHIATDRLWRTSGHLDYYSRNMYFFRKGAERYVVKPMNCPFHIQIYKSRPRSYRELPARYAEWGAVYRHERSGTLHGLLRVRGFTQDDAHIFCTRDEVEEEVFKALSFASYILQKLGFKECIAHLSTRDPKQPAKYMGSEKEWNESQEVLAKALQRNGIQYHEAEGEAVFYGPKIDLNIIDAAGREWQCTTIQFDFNLPRRFGVQYVGFDGKRHDAVMIHRALLGSIERFFAILLEHCKGNIPVWLAPTQVEVLPISDTSLQYAEEVNRKLLDFGIRSELDRNTSTISNKIRNAEVQKIPYMALCGRREAETGKVAVRKHGSGDVGCLSIEELVKIIDRDRT
jgi:threonyl-tRNA synthetase